MVPQIAISTISLGRVQAGHTLPRKIEAAAKAGFAGMEVAYECLEYHSADIAGLPKPTPESPIGREHMEQGAKDIKKFADGLGIRLISIQPWTGYDSLKDLSKSDIERITLWVDLAALMGSLFVQVPSITYPVKPELTTPDYNRIASNIALLADICAPHNLTVGYEAPAWALSCQSWQDIDKVIHLAKRPNVRHCLDTFHVAGLEASDPTRVEAGSMQDSGMEKLHKSLDELKRTLKPEDFAYFQLSDADTLDITQKNYPVKDLNQPPLLTCSRNCRIFPCEPEEYGGVMPILDICKAVFETGYRSWCRMEVFHVQHYISDPSIPDTWAQRGMNSWKEVVRRCGLE